MEVQLHVIHASVLVVQPNLLDIHGSSTDFLLSDALKLNYVGFVMI